MTGHNHGGLQFVIGNIYSRWRRYENRAALRFNGPLKPRDDRELFGYGGNQERGPLLPDDPEQGCGKERIPCRRNDIKGLYRGLNLPDVCPGDRDPVSPEITDAAPSGPAAD